MREKRFFLTTPIYYVNGSPHVGSAYTTIAADVTARFERLRGRRVFFLTGTDENATKVLEAAGEEGISPMAYLERLVPIWKQAWSDLHIEYDDFIRTTEERHVAVVGEIFRRLRESDDIYRGQYEGWYCVPDETFWRESDVQDGLCPNEWCRRPVRRMQEETFFFRLSKYRERLLAWIEEKPERLLPDFRRNEVLAFIRQGLRDQSISRPGDEWGIRVPGETNQTIYVWFDALINYLSATGWPNDEATYRDTWPPDLQLMAKDIFVRFHCTLWPAMLMALGLPLPERLVGHGFWTAEGRKISKSLGNAIEPGELARMLASQSGCEVDIAADAIRYHLLREVPFGQDADFTLEGLTLRFNTDLANDIGNLCNRVVSLCHRLLEGKAPPLPDVESPIRQTIARTAAVVEEEFANQRYASGLQAIWSAIGLVNRTLNDGAPWNLHKAGRVKEAADLLAETLEAVRAFTIMISPVMPYAAERLWSQIGLRDPVAKANWSNCAAWKGVPAGTPLPPPAPIFPRIEKASRAPSSKEKAQGEPEPVRPDKTAGAVRKGEADMGTEPDRSDGGENRITLEEFQKVQLRTARVLAAERVEGTARLLRLDVEMGEEDRTVVAGIAEAYTPEELVGKTVVVVANLEPVKIRGVVSRGMLLAASGADGPVLVSPERLIETGAEVR